MTSKNPLAAFYSNNGAGNGQGPTESLADYCDRLNRMDFTRAMGWEWFINERVKDSGEVELGLDRRDAKPTGPRWKPTPAEAERVREEVTRFVESDMTQAEFNELVRRSSRRAIASH